MTHAADEMRRLSVLLDDAVEQNVALAQRAAETDVAYRINHAKAVLVANGSSADRRDAQALLATSTSYEDRKIAGALYDASVSRIRALETQLRVLQTLAVEERIVT